jgi:mono/diheme cytochrome c family protein
LHGRAWQSAVVALFAFAAPAEAFPPSTHFAIHCQGCHGADGHEVPGLVPRLQGSVGRFLAVPGGREFLIQVPGVAMTHLADSDLADLLNWMLGQFAADEIQTDFTPYDAAEVHHYRRQPLLQVKKVRAELMGRIGAAGLPLPSPAD